MFILFCGCWEFGLLVVWDGYKQWRLLEYSGMCQLHTSLLLFSADLEGGQRAGKTVPDNYLGFVPLATSTQSV